MTASAEDLQGGADVNYAQRAIELVNAESPGLEPELAQLYALLALVKGANASLQDVHDAWAVWRTATRPAHKALVPFGQLAPEVQELDREYMEAIQRAASSGGHAA